MIENEEEKGLRKHIKNEVKERPDLPISGKLSVPLYLHNINIR